MPHRKNAKGDIGSLQRFSDTYDMDNVYLSEEGWVYRHFKNSERTLWWDEILVAGQVKPGMTIHGVNNNPVAPTNPYKLGTAGKATDGGVNHPESNLYFEVGDGYPDYRYSDHDRAPDKVTSFDTGVDDGTGNNLTKDLLGRVDFEETAWSSINVEDPDPTYNDLSTQVPHGWTTSTDPADLDSDEPPYVGEEYQSINHYTVDNPDYKVSEDKYSPNYGDPFEEMEGNAANPVTPGAVVEPGKFLVDSVVTNQVEDTHFQGVSNPFDPTLITDGPDALDDNAGSGEDPPADESENTTELPVQPIVP